MQALPIDSPPAIAVQNLSFAFAEETVLTGIDLAVPNGECLAIIGPNGGGKTTLLRLMLGMFAPSTGVVRILGKAPCTMQRHIGYVPQYPTLRADFPASVLELTLIGAAQPSCRGGTWSTKKKAKNLAIEHLTTLGLGNVLHRPVGALSGGQRQRALVARALMGKPEDENSHFLLLLDEPTASIDPQGKFCFYEFLDKLRGHVTIVVVSHDLLLASPFFTSIAFVNRTLTRLPGGTITPELLISLYGSHQHACPVADLQHATGLHHATGCTHPSCTPHAAEPSRGVCAHTLAPASPKPDPDLP